MRGLGLAILGCLLSAGTAFAQPASVRGEVRDVTGGVLPGVLVELTAGGAAQSAVTDGTGRYIIATVSPGTYQITFSLVNFAPLTRRSLQVAASDFVQSDAVLRLALSADVTVTGKATFTNLADAENPEGNLVGVAQSASQGAITGRQLDTRPIMRAGEVLEAVPGLVISQHSGEGKANQYYLRGFNLDHGTDFATIVAGMPVNMPTHGHGHGYSDVNFLIPELVSGVQFSKGPYFAEHGDFATAGAANINYTNSLARSVVRASGGGQGWARALFAVSPRVASGSWLAALEAGRNDGPWTTPDTFRKVNGVLRFTHGDGLNGFSLTGMGYRANWNSTDQIPERAVASGLNRLSGLDPTDAGDTSRYSGSFEWQRTKGNRATRVTAYGIGYDLTLFSNFTYFLDDPEHGDQFKQADHRFVTGARVSERRLDRWGRLTVQNTYGIQVRNDDIGNVGLYHTEARRMLSTTREDSVLQTSGALYVQNEIAVTPWLRTLAGLRADGYRFGVDAGVPENGGVAYAGLLSPKGGVVVGPFRGTELYANAGTGFHSNDARGATMTRDPTGEPVDRATPLARARGFEVGARTVAVPHLQSAITFWTLRLDSELVFSGDAGTTEAGRPSRRYGFELANYYSPRPWLILDADLALSRARFTDEDVIGDSIPGSVQRVVSAGVTVDSLHNVFGSLRLRYFGPRPLVEDDSVRSEATSLLNLEAGYKVSPSVRVSVDVFNFLNAKASDVDYYYASRLPGEPAGGVNDIHFHPALPRTARLNLTVGF